MDEAAVRAVLSGEQRGIVPSALRSGLHAASVFYAGGVRLRNAGFQSGIRRAHRAPVPVVSVGNITTGGTGKTPFVAWLANWFRERGVRVALLSRGYRALPGDVNDEKLLLDRLCPGVPHLQNPDRVAAARIACEEHAAELLILDDGFQHRRLARDLDVVLIDALNPWGYGYLLPRGLLREPRSSLRRADVVAITRADLCVETESERILQQVQASAPDAVCVEVAFPPAGLVNVSGETAALDTLLGRPLVAFCGIGNPQGFRETLASLEYDVVCFRAFSDHHHFTGVDVDELSSLAEQHNAVGFITTQKDLVKFEDAALGDRPLWAVQIGTRVPAGLQPLETRLEDVLTAAPQQTGSG